MSAPDPLAEVFLAAAELEGDERRRYLDEACGDDGALRAAVLALLAHDRAVPDTFLNGAGAPGRPTDPADALRAIGPYACLRELGRGGQAVVYLARDLRLGRLVALKALEGPTSGIEEVVARFRREAAVASGLRHQGICAVHDAGVAGGTAYIAMQYIEGETLAHRFAERKAAAMRLGAGDIVDLVRIVESVARALHVAHEAGIVHRDIKPANIMIDRGGQPVILDFGLARQEGSGFPTLTRTGDVFGTPAYMSPEQISDAPARVDRRTDVWSLGVTLYEGLTLARPFEAATREGLYRAIVADTPSHARTRNAVVGKDLDVVVAAAMEKSLDRRYQTALDFADDLRRVREREPIRARPPSRWARIGRWAQRNPGFAGSLAAAFVCLAAGLAVALALLRDARLERDTSRRRAYRAGLAAAASAVEFQDQAALRRHLDDAPVELRGWEWRYLDWLADRSLRTLRAERPFTGTLGFSADGSACLAVDVDGIVHRFEIESGARLAGARLDGVSGRSWLAPGARVAAFEGAEGRLVLWDLDAGRTLGSATGVPPVRRFPFAAGGSRLVVPARDRPAARAIDAATGRDLGEIGLDRAAEDVAPDLETPLLIAEAGGSFDLVDASDGRRLWSGRAQLPRVLASGSIVIGIRNGIRGETGELVGFDAATGRERERYALPGRGEIWCFDLHPDGGTVGAGLASGAVVLWDRGESAPREVLLGHASGVVALGFTSDGRRVVSSAPDALKVWASSTSANPWSLATAGVEHHQAACSADGRWLAATRWGDVVLFDVGAEREAWSTYLSRVAVQGVAFDAAGARLAVSTGDRRIHLLEVLTGAVLATAPGPATERLCFAGSRLVAGDGADLRVLDGGSGREIEVVSCGSPIRSIAASQDGTKVAVGLEDGRLRIQALARSGRSADFAAGAGAVTCVAFRGDGRAVAAGFASGPAGIWEVATGRRQARLEGATTAIRLAAFDPAGSRIVTADAGRYFHVFDAASGLELFTMRSPALLFPPQVLWWDGRTLLTGDRPHPIIAFETGPPAGGFERRELHRRARAHATRQFSTGRGTVLAEDVVAALEADPSLPEEVRRIAIAVARGRGDDLNRLNGLAWEAVLTPGTPAEHAHALRQIARVCRTCPEEWAFLNTLALALYRMERYGEALATLRRCDEINHRAGRSSHPSDLAVMAMAAQRSGQAEAARAHLDAARAAAADPALASDEDTLRLIREAEALLDAAPGLPPVR